MYVYIIIYGGKGHAWNGRCNTVIIITIIITGIDFSKNHLNIIVLKVKLYE